MAAVPPPVESEQAPAQGATPEVRCWLDVFSTLKSGRKARGVRYEVGPVLALVVIAVLCGCKNASQIFAFALARPRLLPRLGFKPPRQIRKPENAGRVRAPNEDTIAAILHSVSQEELNEKFAVFLRRMIGHQATAAVDGKALRGADDYVLSVFVNDIRQVVWQERVGEKENELKVLEKALPAVLAQYPGLTLLTGDAAFCHKSIARELVQARRDYFLQLKAPHTTDVALATEAFKTLGAKKPLATSQGKRGAQKVPNA